MIGWYIHHVGLGHLHRAEAVSARLGRPVAGLSSLPRPSGWKGPWIELPRDDDSAVDPTAGGQLHWAPLLDGGLRTRMASVSAWIEQQRPELIVADVSAEIALLARLHGVPVLSVVLPGDRSDDAHLMGYRVSDALVAAWPRAAHGVVHGLPDDVERRIEHVGGLSRFDVSATTERENGPPRVTMLTGAGGTTVSPIQLTAAQREATHWTWTILAPPPLGTWTADPAQELRTADVVITHAGQSAIAEVAAARRPAIVVPERRPHAEQEATARALASDGWPTRVLWAWPARGWPALLEEACDLDGGEWLGWCDGGAAQRFARIIERSTDRLSHRSLDRKAAG